MSISMGAHGASGLGLHRCSVSGGVISDKLRHILPEVGLSLGLSSA